MVENSPAGLRTLWAHHMSLAVLGEHKQDTCVQRRGRGQDWGMDMGGPYLCPLLLFTFRIPLVPASKPLGSSGTPGHCSLPCWGWGLMGAGFLLTYGLTWICYTRWADSSQRMSANFSALPIVLSGSTPGMAPVSHLRTVSPQVWGIPTG
jgi:hypothetical protein